MASGPGFLLVPSSLGPVGQVARDCVYCLGTIEVSLSGEHSELECLNVGIQLCLKPFSISLMISGTNSLPTMVEKTSQPCLPF